MKKYKKILAVLFLIICITLGMLTNVSFAQELDTEINTTTEELQTNINPVDESLNNDISTVDNTSDNTSNVSPTATSSSVPLIKDKIEDEDVIVTSAQESNVEPKATETPIETTKPDLTNVPDGNETSITFKIDGLKNIVLNNFDSITYQGIMDQVALVDAGTLTPADTVKVDTTFTSLKVTFEEDIKPGEALSIFIGMGLNDPYHATVIEPQNSEENTYRNYASLTGETIIPGGTNVPFNLEGNSFARPIMKEEQLSLSKGTTNNVTGAVGEGVQYRFSVNISDLAKYRKLDNFRLIDLLPVGVTYKSIYENNQPKAKSIDVIENYNNSGKTAIILNYGDVQPKDFAGSIMIAVDGVINGNAIPFGFETDDINNNNEVYLLSDSLQDIPSNIKIGTTVDGIFKNETGKGRVIDTFDLDEDGDTTDLVIMSNSKTKALTPLEIRSEKFIRKGDDPWVLTGVQTAYEEGFEYKISTRNYSDKDITTFTLYDVLPYANDNLDSKFSNILNGPINFPEGFTVYYRTDVPPTDAKEAVLDDKWVTDVVDYSTITAFKIVMNTGTLIKPGEVMDVIIPMKAPEYTDGSIDTTKAINSFYTSRDNQESFGKGNNVYNQLPQEIPVEKVWAGKALDEVEVEVYREVDNVRIATLKLNATNNFKDRFRNLAPVDDTDSIITDYKVREIRTEELDNDYKID